MSTEAMTARDWLKALGVLVAPAGMSLDDAKERLDKFAPLLGMEFDRRAFNASSLAHVARRQKFFPTFHELCQALSEWAKDNRPLPQLALADNVTDLGPDDRSWLAWWHRREAENFSPPRESDGRLSRPDITDWRLHAASLLRRMSPKAWELIESQRRAA